MKCRSIFRLLITIALAIENIKSSDAQKCKKGREQNAYEGQDYAITCNSMTMGLSALNLEGVVWNVEMEKDQTVIATCEHDIQVEKQLHVQDTTRFTVHCSGLKPKDSNITNFQHFDLTLKINKIATLDEGCYACNITYNKSTNGSSYVIAHDVLDLGLTAATTQGVTTPSIQSPTKPTKKPDDKGGDKKKDGDKDKDKKEEEEDDDDDDGWLVNVIAFSFAGIALMVMLGSCILIVSPIFLSLGADDEDQLDITKTSDRTDNEQYENVNKVASNVGRKSADGRKLSGGSGRRYGETEV